MTPSAEWVVLVYRIPSQPSRLRLQVWRTLQRMGAVYIQDAVCLLPYRPDLLENMHYVAATVEDMGGTSHLFAATAVLPNGSARLEEEFRAQLDRRLDEISSRLSVVHSSLEGAATASDLERIEDEIKRERMAYLRVRRLAYFGSTKEPEVDAQLNSLKSTLDDLYRSVK